MPVFIYAPMKVSIWGQPSTRTDISAKNRLMLLTWDLGGELCDGRRAETFHGARPDSEGVCRARVEPHEEVRGLVAVLENLPALVWQVKLRVERANGLVWNLPKGSDCQSSYKSIIRYLKYAEDRPYAYPLVFTSSKKSLVVP